MASRDLSSNGCTKRDLQTYCRIDWKMRSRVSRLPYRHASVIA